MGARPGTPWGGMALSLLAAILLAPAARAGDPCQVRLGTLFGAEEGGLGGTGHSDPAGGIGGTGQTGTDGGIGGTGLEPREGGIGGTALGDAESGPGGTGLEAREGGIGGTGWTQWAGPGGTGVIGTVTGFGSVCVNGLHVDYDASTSVELDGRIVGSDRLAVGHVVEVDARPGPTRLQARSIRVRHAVVGPVSGFDAQTGRLLVAGQSVAVPGGVGVGGRRSEGAGPVDELPPGGFVAVSGLRRSDGVIVATRVEPTEARERVTVEGAVTRVAPGTWYVSGLRVEARGPDAERALREGGVARVTGRWDAERGALEDAQVEPSRRAADDARRLSVEGYVQERGEGPRFRLPGLEVDASDVARELGDAGRDTRVRVGGRLLEDGTLRAERVEVDDSRLGFQDERPRSDDLRAARGGREDREDREDREGREDREDREDRSGRTERVERSERIDRAERPERPERGERSGRQ